VERIVCLVSAALVAMLFLSTTALAEEEGLQHMSGIGVAEKSDVQTFINLIPMRFAS
jgi:hypothetical protein